MNNYWIKSVYLRYENMFQLRAKGKKSAFHILIYMHIIPTIFHNRAL